MGRCFPPIRQPRIVDVGDIPGDATDGPGNAALTEAALRAILERGAVSHLHRRRRLRAHPHSSRVRRPRPIAHDPPRRRPSRLPRRGVRRARGLLVADASRVGDGARRGHRAGRAARRRERPRRGARCGPRCRQRPGDGARPSPAGPDVGARADSAGRIGLRRRSTSTASTRPSARPSPRRRREASPGTRPPSCSAASARAWWAPPSPSSCRRSTSTICRRSWCARLMLRLAGDVRRGMG